MGARKKRKQRKREAPTSRVHTEFGYAEECQDFERRHILFLERFPSLSSAINLAFVRILEHSDVTDRAIFFSGRLCAEDFMEILLLCSNGYGVAGLKLVRGMYERAVTARFLHLHPEETGKFFDFHWIQQRKLAKAIQKTFAQPLLSEKALQTVESNFQRVHRDFLVTVCKDCGRKDVNYTWSKLDFVSMAGAVGSLGDLIVPAYYLPTREAHSTMGAILSRLTHGEGGSVAFDAGPQRNIADDALMTAHSIILHILDLQKEHFAINGLSELLQTCFQDFLQVWKKSN